jgi:hypothetical protein
MFFIHKWLILLQIHAVDGSQNWITLMKVGFWISQLYILRLRYKDLRTIILLSLQHYMFHQELILTSDFPCSLCIQWIVSVEKKIRCACFNIIHVLQLYTDQILSLTIKLYIKHNTLFCKIFGHLAFINVMETTTQ